MSKLMLIIGVGSLLTACAHFNGPGGYKTSSDYAPSGSASAAPVGASSATPSEMDQFHIQWPVSFVRITQGFEPAKNPHHKGIDIGGRRGTPIFAAHPGTVIYRGRAFHGYGNMVLIEYNNEWATLYGHLQKIRVHEGDRVTAGTVIGTMGRTGRATGVHLHFELMHNKEPINPLQYLATTHIVAK